jgi:hypothetical protein
MAKVEYTEGDYDEERVPKGDDYIAFFAGFRPRDRDTMLPHFYEIDKRDYDRGGEKTGERETRITWLFEVIYPKDFRGSEIPGSAPWKGFKVTKNAQGDAVVQVNRVGQQLVNMVKWCEACGIDWNAALGDALPDTGTISDQMILEALDRALLDCARQGALVVIKTKDDGRIDTKDQNDTCLMPLGVGPKADKVKGIQYDVPDFYGTAGGTLPPGAVEGGAWTDAELDALRKYIREDVKGPLTTGENMLEFKPAGEAMLAQAATQGGDDYEARAKAFAALMAEGGYDAMQPNVLIGLVSVLTGSKAKNYIIDSLAPPQLETAAKCLAGVARALGKEVPDPPLPAGEPELGGDEEIPF